MSNLELKIGNCQENFLYLVLFTGILNLNTGVYTNPVEGFLISTVL